MLLTDCSLLICSDRQLCSVINSPCTFSFPRKIQKGPGIPTGPVINVLIWFVITYKLASNTFPCQHTVVTHKPLLYIYFFYFYQGVEDALSIRSLGSHRVGILSYLHSNSKTIPLLLKKQKSPKYWQNPFIGKSCFLSNYCYK